MAQPGFARITTLTFDCYGTLIDWEAGVLEVLRPLVRHHGRSARLLTEAPDLEVPDLRSPLACWPA